MARIDTGRSAADVRRRWRASTAMLAFLVVLVGCPAMHREEPPPPPPPVGVPPPPPPPPPTERRGDDGFPWPPPRASAEFKIPDAWLRAGTSTTLAGVAERLERAIDRAHYRRWSYATLNRDGFVLLTQLEQTRPDGTPLPVPERWSADDPSITNLNLLEFVQSLAVAPRGHYRIIAFVVTDRRWTRPRVSPSEGEAQDWLDSGLDALPQEIGDARYGRGYRTTALVYEFEKRRGHEATFVPESRASGLDHLRRAGITKPLSDTR